MTVINITFDEENAGTGSFNATEDGRVTATHTSAPYSRILSEEEITSLMGK